jgi:ribonuclease J
MLTRFIFFDTLDQRLEIRKSHQCDEYRNKMSKITLYGGVGEIGGNKVLLEDNSSRILLDFGMSFKKVGYFLDEFLQFRTNTALSDLLKLSILPEIHGIYRKDFIKPVGIEEALQQLPPDFAERYIPSVQSYQEYQEKNSKPYVQGIFVSHCHGDHVSHLAFLDPEIPIFCSSVTQVMLEAIQTVSKSGVQQEVHDYKERMVSKNKSGAFPGSFRIISAAPSPRKFQILEPYAAVAVGNFRVTGIPVDHSVPGAMAFYVETSDGKRLLYTGDFRFHGRFAEHSANLREFVSKNQIDFLMSEGTRIEQSRQEQDDEARVGKEIAEVVQDTEKLVLVDFGWKDTTRYDTLREVARKTRRTLVISPKLAYLLEKLKRYNSDLFPGIPEDGSVRIYLERSGSLFYSPADYTLQKFKLGYDLDSEETEEQGGTQTGGSKSSRQKSKMTEAYLSGNQEYLKQMLPHYYGGVRAYDIAKRQSSYILHAGFFDINELLDITPDPGSVFIKAAVMPFNDEMKIDQEKLEHWLDYFHFVKAEEKGYLYYKHTSGHACGEDLFDFIKLADPGALIPIHTQEPRRFEDSGKETILCQEGEAVPL